MASELARHRMPLYTEMSGTTEAMKEYAAPWANTWVYSCMRPATAEEVARIVRRSTRADGLPHSRWAAGARRPYEPPRAPWPTPVAVPCGFNESWLALLPEAVETGPGLALHPRGWAHPTPFVEEIGMRRV